MHKKNPAKCLGLCILIVSTQMFSCTDSDVEAKSTFLVPQVDDQLVLHGQVCTRTPDDSDFPVKIMFIVDCSGSLQQTDEGAHRAEAVRQVVRRYADNPNVFFNVIKFNGVVTELTPGGFMPLQGNEDNIFGPAGLLQADSMTDYQGALGKAYQILESDMNKTLFGAGGQAELTRTKYVVIFFSDGTPDPLCYGCSTDPASPRYLDPCQGTYDPYNLCCDEDAHVICQTLDNTDNVINLNIGAVCDERDPNNPDDNPKCPCDGPRDPTCVFSELAGGADYNQSYQIFQLIDGMMELKRTFHAGEMRFHSAFLYCRDQFGNPTSALCEAAELAYHLDPDRGRALLREMSHRGNGTFRDFTSGQDINFLEIDYTSIKRTYVAKNLLVTNINAMPSIVGFLPDSDGDGLDDDLELRNGTDPLARDSDGDGYQDFVEENFRNAGFDPSRPDRPVVACSDTSDEDGDRLANCEESLFGAPTVNLDTKLVDSDGDGFPDGTEVLFGMDPTRNDIFEDMDADGRRNGDELLFHTNPARSDPGLWNDHRYWYEMRPGISDLQDRLCYEFDVRYLTLVTTLDRNGPGSRGYNDILIWFDQAAQDDSWEPGRFRVACVRAQYIAPDYKIPFKGEISIKDSDFVAPQDLDLSFSSGTCVTGSND